MNKALLIGIIIAVVASMATVFFTIFSLESDQNTSTTPSTNFNTVERMKCINDIPNKKLTIQGITKSIPFLVQIEWNPYELRNNQLTEIKVTMLENETKKPLSDVTYDFVYKGPLDLGEINNRYVVDFSAEADVLRVELRYPCDIHFLFNIDQVGDRSFLRTDPDEIEKYGNASPVAVEFRVTQTDKGTLSIEVFTSSDT